jgi:gamma-glutamyltranspeptidase/glutathione hydrolase
LSTLQRAASHFHGPDAHTHDLLDTPRYWQQIGDRIAWRVVGSGRSLPIHATVSIGAFDHSDGVRMTRLSPIAAAGALTALTAFLAPAPAALEAQRPSTLAGRSTVYAPSAAVATSQPLASAAGLEVLRQGGNAIDAAVAAAAVLSVTEPHMTGIGGDMFAIVWLAKEQKLVALNASGRAGSRMTRETLQARGFRAGSQQGVMSVTVPGALAGWDKLVRTYGRRTLAQALQPAIGYARDGFPVSPIIAAQWANETAFLQRDSAAAATFLPGGHAPKAGEWFRNPDYARTLQGIATNGIGTFYGGALGQRIVARLQALDGFITLDDLRKNAPNWVTPISVPFRGYRVWELPPNNQGIAALEMLRILEPYDLKAMGHNSAPYLHHLIEAKKLAYADLDRFVGDADHLDIPAERMLTDEFIVERRSHLDPSRAQARVDPGPLRTQSETVYLTTADAEGNMVSFINSNYDYFGSGIVVPGTGFVLHNRGAGFTLTPGLPNTVAPGKRPFHTLIPGFVTQTVNGREQAYMSFGLMGGGVQAQGHVQFLLNYFVFGMDVQAAIDAPRFRHYDGLRVALEAPISDATRTALTAMGHVLIEQPPVAFGGAQVIVRLPKGFAAGSDPRKDGMAVGY